MSQLIDFFSCEAPDGEGRNLEEFIIANDAAIEFSHDWIQWVFPLTELSNYNCDAPILNAADIKAFHEDAFLAYNLLRVFERFMNFCGLHYNHKTGIVEFADNFDDRRGAIWAHFNHNHLRITRVLKCLKTLGLDNVADAFYDRLKEIYEWKKFKITPESFRFWSAAVGH